MHYYIGEKQVKIVKWEFCRRWFVKRGTKVKKKYFEVVSENDFIIVIKGFNALQRGSVQSYLCQE